MKQVPIKTKTARAPLNTSAFLTSPKAEEIFDIINEQKGKVTQAELYRRCKALDPNLPTLVAFGRFLKKLDADQNKRASVLLARLKDNLMDDDENVGEKVLKKLLNNAYQKIFVMGDVVISQELDDIRERLESGAPLTELQKKKVMHWFFKGTDAFTKHRAVDIKVKADERAETLMENLITACQYGHAKKADIVEAEIIDDEPKSLQSDNATA